MTTWKVLLKRTRAAAAETLKVEKEPENFDSRQTVKSQIRKILMVLM